MAPKTDWYLPPTLCPPGVCAACDQIRRVLGPAGWDATAARTEGSGRAATQTNQ